MPGGWTVMDRTCGRRLRCRYAALIDVTIGPSPLPVRTARHCRYRAFGLEIGEPLALVAAGDHVLHVSSGVSVLPERVNISIRPSDGTVACQLSAPHVATVCASRASDSYVPRAARSAPRRNSLPGFAVAQ